MHKELLELKVQQDLKVLQVRAQQDHKVYKEPPAHREPQDHKV